MVTPPFTVIEGMPLAAKGDLGPRIAAFVGKALRRERLT